MSVAAVALDRSRSNLCRQTSDISCKSALPVMVVLLYQTEVASLMIGALHTETHTLWTLSRCKLYPSTAAVWSSSHWLSARPPQPTGEQWRKCKAGNLGSAHHGHQTHALSTLWQAYDSGSAVAVSITSPVETAIPTAGQHHPVACLQLVQW